MSDAKTVHGPVLTGKPGAAAGEREPDECGLGSACPEACRACRQACPESALIGRTVIEARCRRRSAPPSGPGFTFPGCPLCRESRPQAPAAAPAAWRKGFRG